jgi:uncharacterized protein (TIGR04168 family)
MQDPPHSPEIKLIAIGDIHNDWDLDSEAALHHLNGDAVILLGDFGNQDVQLVQSLTSLKHQHRLAAILGNHDAWFSLTNKGRTRAAHIERISTLPNPINHQAVEQQLEALGPHHVGYSSIRWPELQLSVVGARPFSKGGKDWKSVASFYEKHYQVYSLEESFQRIFDSVLSTTASDALVMLAHNGPSGLGDERYAPCGVDWLQGGVAGDHGDPDLEEALHSLAAHGRPPCLVLFGHMHHTLKKSSSNNNNNNNNGGGGLRNRIVVDNNTGMVVLNCAVVPRIVPLNMYGTTDDDDDDDDDSSSSSGSKGRAHHFVEVILQNGMVKYAADVWVGVEVEESDVSLRCFEVERKELIVREEDNDSCRYRYHKAYSNEWRVVDIQSLTRKKERV